MNVMVFVWAGGQEAEEQDEALMQEMIEFVGGLATTGKLTGGGSLKPPGEGKTIRARRGEVTVMDGPYAELRENVEMG